MAKQSSVFYKLPIEDMRGKLATKQKPILYSGQEEGQNTLSIGEGLHQAKNFEKYIVLTKRRSKNFFYVKSKTSIRNTASTNLQRATLAIASDIADYLKPFLEFKIFLDVQEAFQYWGGSKTFREWLTSLAMEAISTNREYILCKSAPDGQGLIVDIQLMKNPLYSFDVVASEVRPEGVLSGAVYTDNDRTKGLLQEYFRYYAGLLETFKQSITVVSDATGRKYPIVLLYQTGSPSDTFQALQGTIQGAAYNVVFDSASPAVMTGFSVISKDGVVKLTGSNILDQNGSSINVATAIPSVTELVIS